MKKIKKYIFHLPIIVMLVAIIFLANGCTSFEVKKYSDNKQENLVYNIMSLYGKAKDKTVSAKAIDNYYKYLHREQCKFEIFEKGIIDYSDYKKLNAYNICLKELN